MTYLIVIDNNSKSYFERGNENIKNRINLKYLPYMLKVRIDRINHFL